MNWTRSLRERVRNAIPLEDLLPDRLPAFSRSYIYSLGGLTLSSLLVIVLTGMVMVAYGPTWWQVSHIGAVVRAMHYWGVQTFFFCMTLHLVVGFFTAAWRGGRAITWMLGALLYVFAITEAFTGYLMRGDFFSQWNQVQGKDAINSSGLGAFLNVLNNGQLYGVHILLFPALLLLVLLPAHLFFIRKKGLVPPPEEG